MVPFRNQSPRESLPNEFSNSALARNTAPPILSKIDPSFLRSLPRRKTDGKGARQDTLQLPFSKCSFVEICGVTFLMRFGRGACRSFQRGRILCIETAMRRPASPRFSQNPEERNQSWRGTPPALTSVIRSSSGITGGSYRTMNLVSSCSSIVLYYLSLLRCYGTTSDACRHSRYSTPRSPAKQTVPILEGEPSSQIGQSSVGQTSPPSASHVDANRQNPREASQRQKYDCVGHATFVERNSKKIFQKSR